MPFMKKKLIQVTIPEELVVEIDRLAKLENRSRTQQVKSMLELEVPRQLREREAIKLGNTQLDPSEFQGAAE
jgi:metal-responsive CopG/Arc/MetJ family transcriptional regulator